MRTRFVWRVLLLVCLQGSWAFAVIEPTVVPQGFEDYEPLYYTGAIERDVPYGNGSFWTAVASGAVAGHPRMVLSCAHLNYKEGIGWIGAGTTRWCLQWNRSGKPQTFGETGLTLTGFYRFDGYAALADQDAVSGNYRSATYAKDYVVHYHASANTANGYFAPLLEESSTFLLGKSTNLKPFSKKITGYPSDQYDTEDSRKYRMHETVPFTNKATVGFGSFLRIAGVTTYGGNSGGPLWGRTDGRWAHLGVVVSSDKTTLVGVTANHALGNGLIFSALQKQFPDSPVWRNEVPVNSIGSIPDGGTLTRTFSVSKMLGVIEKVELNIQIRHPRRGDLQITLTSPQNRSVTIFRTVSVRQSSPPNLSAQKLVLGFIGQKANGIWKLSIKDAYRTRAGTLDAATLHLTTR